MLWILTPVNQSRYDFSFRNLLHSEDGWCVCFLFFRLEQTDQFVYDRFVEVVRAKCPLSNRIHETGLKKKKKKWQRMPEWITVYPI